MSAVRRLLRRTGRAGAGREVSHAGIRLLLRRDIGRAGDRIHLRSAGQHVAASSDD